MSFFSFPSFSSTTPTTTGGTPMRTDPTVSPLLPPPIKTNKKLVILLTNAPKLEKSKKATGFDIRDVAHVCEILFYYFSRQPNPDFPGYKKGKSEEVLGGEGRIFGEPEMDWNKLSEHFVIASLHGGEAPIDPMSLEEGKHDIVTKEFMRCTDLMNMLRNTKKITDFKPTDCYGCIVVGGRGAMEDLPVNKELGQWLYAFYEGGMKKTPGTTTTTGTTTTGGVLATICHGTAALLSISRTGESLTDPSSDKEPRWLSNRRITCFSNNEERQLKMDTEMPFSLEDRCRSVGAHIMIGEPFEIKVVLDDRLITGQNSESVRSVTKVFIRTIYKEFGGHHKPTL